MAKAEGSPTAILIGCLVAIILLLLLIIALMLWRLHWRRLLSKVGGALRVWAGHGVCGRRRVHRVSAIYRAWLHIRNTPLKSEHGV